MTARGRSLVPAGGALLVLLLAALFRAFLLEPILVRALQSKLGLSATVESIRGVGVAGLDLLGVQARGERGAGPVSSFEARRLAARYSLAALLRGTDAFLDSLDVAVEGARLDLDLTVPEAAERQPAAPAAPRTGGPPPHPLEFPTLPRLKVSDSRLLVRGKGYEIEADGLQGEVSRRDGARGQAVEIRAQRLLLQHPALRQGTVSIAVSARLAPRSLTIAAARMDGDPLVERGRLDLGERRGDLDLEFDLRLWDGSVGVGVVRRAGGTEVRWDARGVDIRPDLILVNPALGALRGRLTTKGSARIGSEGLPTLSGTLSLDWEGARIAGRAVDRLSVEASAEPGVVSVASAEGHIGPNEVRLRRVALPSPPLFGSRWRTLLSDVSGDFSASLGDVPAFLALWGIRTGGAGAAAPVHRLRLEGAVERGTVRFSQGSLEAGVGKAALDAVTVTLPREDQGWRETAFAGAATIDVPRLQEVSALFPMPALGGSLRGGVSGRGTFARPEGSASLAGRRVTVAGRMIGDVDLTARAAAGTAELGKLEVRQGGNRLTARDIRFSVASLAAAERAGFLESLAGSFDLRCADIPAIATLASIPAEKVAPLPAEHLLTATGTVRDRAVSVTAGSFAAAGATVTLRGGRLVLPAPGADWRKDSVFEGDLEAEVPDLGPVASVFRLPSLQGAVRARAKIAGSAGDPTGSLEASGRGIAVRGHRVGDVALRIAARQRAVQVESVDITRGEDRLRGRGSYDPAKGTLAAVEADVVIADLAPWLADFWPGGIPVSGRLHARVSAAGPLPGSPLSVEAEVSDGAVLKARAVKGTVAATFGVTGTMGQPRIEAASLAARLDGEGEGRPVRLSVDAGYEPGRLLVRALDVAGAQGLTVKGEGTLPLDLAAEEILSPGSLAFQARASIPDLASAAFLVPPAYRITGTLGADVSIAGSWKEPQARLEIRGERLQAPPGTRFVPPDPFALSGAVAWSAKEARAENVRLESPALSCSLSGSWTSPPRLSSAFSTSGGGGAGSLAFRASLASPDLAWLRESVEGLRGLRGSLAGEIAVEGTAGDPRFSGSIRVAEAAFRYRDLPPVDALSVRASVEHRTVTLEELAGNVGGSPFTLAGTVDLSHPRDPVLDLRLRGRNALLYRAEGLRVRADSDLTLRGPASALALAGEVGLTDSVYQRTFSVVDLFSGENAKGRTAKRPATGFAGVSFPDPPLRDMRLDVRLTAREPFRIMTTVVRGSARPDLRLGGTGLLPVLRGPVSFGATQVVLPSGILEFERGSVLFREGGIGRAELEFGGRMQSLGYEITAQVGGTFEAPEVVLSSLPPLPKEELLLFVLTGAPPAGTRGTGGDSVTAMATPMAVFLGKGVLDNLLGAGAGGADLQGRLEVQVGRELTRSGSTTMDARLLLKKDPLGKGTMLYLTGEKDVYDQENVGVRILFKLK